MNKKNVSILLVDDNEKFLDSMAQRAEIKGYHVFKATNGEQALEIASSQTIHVAVVDQEMPGMEGLVVITKLKAITPDIKTLLLTGHGDEKLKDATQALNSAYFDKEDISGFWDFLANLSLGKINILLVDDNPRFLKTVADRIRLKGHEPLTALNGKEALEIMESNRIHLAIVDQRMPDMEGLVLITRLKKIDPAIKTMLLTGHGDEKLKEATEALNSSYFEKEDMGSFWGIFRKILNSLETTMAAAGMAEGGDYEDALKIKGSKKTK
ncbi:MAG: response regulator [Desulfobacteraceae bacterium]|nr:response regulator [Desulfobacteraceae bacterium]